MEAAIEPPVSPRKERVPMRRFVLLVVVSTLLVLPFSYGPKIDPNGESVAYGPKIDPNGAPVAYGLEIDPDGHA